MIDSGGHRTGAALLILYGGDLSFFISGLFFENARLFSKLEIEKIIYPHS